jgi:molybdopterin converting factor small subunit
MPWKRRPEYVMCLANPEAVYRRPKMRIKLFLPASLNYLVEGKDLFEVNGRTVGECLNQLVSIAPVMKGALFYESGDWLHPTIKVLVNQDSVDAEVLATKLEDGDEIEIKTDRH